VLIASYVVGGRPNNDGSDIFAADKAWWYITLLTIGYMISRGRRRPARAAPQRGGRPGDPVDDWRRAEAELREE
jgi:hypothetical protein